MSKTFETAKDKLISGQRSVCEHWRSWFLFFYYNSRWARLFSFKFWLMPLFTALPAAFGPLLTWYFAPKVNAAEQKTAENYRLGSGEIGLSLDLPQGLGTSLWWGGLLVLVGMLAAAAARSVDKRKDDQKIAAELVKRAGEAVLPLRRVARSGPQSDDRKVALEACLSIMELYVRFITNANAGDIGVSFAQYQGSHTSRLRIDIRNKGSRRSTGQHFDGTHNIGHHSCLAGVAPRTVHDLKKFGEEACKSPTRSDDKYRSIFIIPLVSDAVGDEAPRCVGYISIDSIYPYAFHGNRDKLMAVDLASIVAHFKNLI